MTKSIRAFLTLILVCLVVYLPGLSSIPPIDRDEARFAQATRQMLETKDFVRIYFQNTPRHKKPVGIHWFQAIAVAVIGSPQHILPYRIPSIIGALVSVLLTFYFGRILFNHRVAMLGAVFLGSSLILVVEAHQATTDAVLLASIVAAQGSLACLYIQGHRGSLFLRSDGVWAAVLFWVAQSIGILVKGPITPIVSSLTIIGLLMVGHLKLQLVRNLRLLLGIAIMLALISPWFFLVYLATDGTFIIEAIKNDLLPKLLDAKESHGAPFGYFFFLVAATFWPASLFLGPVLTHICHWQVATGTRFCLAWIIGPWLLFEMVPTKLPHYILPVYPALSLLTAATVCSASNWLRMYLWYKVWFILTVIISGTMLAVLVLFGQVEYFWLTFFVDATILRIAWLVLLLTRRQLFLTAVVIANFSAQITFITIFYFLLPSLKSLWLSQSIREVIPLQEFAVVAGYYEPSLVFSLGSNITFANGQSIVTQLAAAKNTIAIIECNEENAFRASVKLNNLAVERLSTINGFNYSRGRYEILNIYSISHP